MPGSDSCTPMRRNRLLATWTATISVLRGLPFLVASRPGTPLRVLCLMAFDTVHVFRTSRRISADTLRTMAALLDLGAFANDAWDSGDCSGGGFEDVRRQLAGSRACFLADEYLSRLRDLEQQRPPTGSDDSGHHAVVSYRESVNRLSLGVLAATALGSLSIEEAIRSTHDDEDIRVLFDIVMLCQIIDDLADFSKDAAHMVPGFLTAHASLSQALSLTSRTAAKYASDTKRSPTSPHLFPFRVAMTGMSIFTTLAILAARWRFRLRSLRTSRPLIPDRLAGR